MGRGGKTAESGGRVGRQLLAGDLDRPLHPHPRLSGALHCLAVRRRLDVRASEESPGSFILVALEPECVRGDVLVVRWAGRVTRCIRRRAGGGSVWRRATTLHRISLESPMEVVPDARLGRDAQYTAMAPHSQRRYEQSYDEAAIQC
jgi:hypothetical protein